MKLIESRPIKGPGNGVLLTKSALLNITRRTAKLIKRASFSIAKYTMKPTKSALIKSLGNTIGVIKLHIFRRLRHIVTPIETVYRHMLQATGNSDEGHIF